MIDMNSRYRRSETVVGRTVVDEFVLVPLEDDVLQTRTLFTSNGVGARIWDLLADETSLGRIAEHLTSEYDVHSAQAESDLVEFIAAMEQRGFVRSCG